MAYLNMWGGGSIVTWPTVAYEYVNVTTSFGSVTKNTSAGIGLDITLNKIIVPAGTYVLSATVVFQNTNPAGTYFLGLTNGGSPALAEIISSTASQSQTMCLVYSFRSGSPIDITLWMNAPITDVYVRSSSLTVFGS